MSKYDYEYKLKLASETDFSPAKAYRPRLVGKAENTPPLASNILIDTVHDGYVIPGLLAEKYQKSKRRKKEDDYYRASFFAERDWGAGLVAAAIARRLGIGKFYENLVARNALDFNRFPGINRSESQHLDRFSISGRLVPDILEQECAETLIDWYERVSEGMEKAIEGVFKEGANRPSNEGSGSKRAYDEILQSRFIRLSVHTFDKNDGQTGRRRPKVSIVHRSDAIEKNGRLPADTFHHLYPPELATFTCDRMLKSALSCGFETHYIPEHSDSPYMHPEGGVEMRLQALLWFRYLRMVFEEKRPDVAKDLKGLGVSKGAPMEKETAYEAYWQSVTNPNSIYPLTRVVRAFVDRRIVNKGYVPSRNGGMIHLDDIWKIDQAVSAFFEEEQHAPDAMDGAPRFVRDFQYAPFRPSTLVIEVRKDALFRDYDADKRTASDPDEKFIEKIAQSVATGFEMYEQLLEVKQDQVPFERRA